MFTLKNLFRPKPQLKKYSYSQVGEDLIIQRLLKLKNIDRFEYLDIGANDPISLSNTYLFYLSGNRGVCIEPNPELAKRFSKIRSRDTVLNAGIGIDGKKTAEFYLMDWHEFSTFSKERAEEVERHYKGANNIKQVMQLPTLDINEVFQKHFSQTSKFVNVDVEGLDFEILQMIDFNTYKPEIFCVECIDVTQKDAKRKDLITFFEGKGYSLFADTSINYIFSKN
jgi:FkbM family methyltransferase